MGWLSRLFQQQPKLDEAAMPRLSPHGGSKGRELMLDNWATSPEYLALLQRFSSIRDFETGVPDYWQPMFGVEPKKVVKAFIESGALVEAPLPDKVQFCNTVTQLKEMLAARGLKVTGKKAEQVERLIQADSKGMQNLYGDRLILRCSTEAKQAVDTWNQERTETLSRVADEVIAALRRQKFAEAIQVADSYKSQRLELPIHPGQEAMTIKSSRAPLAERAKELTRVFTMKPKILKGLSGEQWEGLYLNYAVWKLIGTSFPCKCMPGFSGLRSMDESTVTRMLNFYVGHMEDKARWKPLGIKKAKISCSNSGSCESCKALDGQVYSLNKLPELPYDDCTCALGCRCLYLPELDF